MEEKRIDENEILFINWESINRKDKNTIIKENEQEFYLEAVVKNTKEEGREIILVIDESHHTANSEKSRELINAISPKITIEVSATPQLKEDLSRFVKVELGDVKAEEMIKTEIAINPEFMNIKVGKQSVDELVIGQALRKRELLKKMLEKEGSNVNPLVLIQLPDKREGVEDKKEDITKILKDKFSITEKNGRLAIWLSEDKSETLINIVKDDNEVEVLIFKQAIALGWDCPRASILVIFRESKSFRFTIQTIGRIMRMPEWKHYKKETELNRGFVFTNLSNIDIEEDYAKDYITIFESMRRDELYQNISLNSVYLKRQRERTRLSGEFIKIFADIASKMNLKDKITPKPSTIVNPVIADGKIVNIDKTGEVQHKGTIDVRLSEKEIQNRFDDFIRSSCTPFAPKDSSDRMKTALYQFVSKQFGIDKYDPNVQKIVLGTENAQTFLDVITLAKAQYKTKVIQQLSEKREIQPDPNWEVPNMIRYTSKYIEKESKRSIMKPLYVIKPSEPEIRFMEMLNHSDRVKWWFRNGEGEIKYFAVLYIDENGVERGFYVDFIVMFNDRSIGLFDTKSGITAATTGPRAEGLQRYIRQENKQGKKLWGGIVIYVNGSCLYNKQEKYRYDPNNLEEWEVLEVQATF